MSATEAPSKRSRDAVESHRTRYSRRASAIALHGVLTATLVRVRVIGDLTTLLRRPHGDPTALLSDRGGTAIVLCIPKMRADCRRSMRLCGDHAVFPWQSFAIGTPP